MNDTRQQIKSNRFQLNRERSALDTATLGRGAEEAIEFLLPLFAGAVLGLSAWETGLLVALDQLVAFLMRPIAGRMVDRAHRVLISAIGAFGYGFGCLAYAAATGFGLAALGAVLCGASGAFLWIAIRAIVGERIHEDSSVFARLMSAEETGGWLVVIPAIILLDFIGYSWVFVGLAACCVVAAIIMLTAIRTEPTKPAQVEHVRSQSFTVAGKSLRPMLVAVAITMAAESAIGLLLLIHLQRGFGLGVMETALVFMPGAIAMAVLPPYLHNLVVLCGRKQMLMSASIASTCFAVALAYAPSPEWIAGLWILSAFAWAVVIPIQQAVIAEAVGPDQLGQGLGLYEAAALAGTAVGSLAAGFLYASGSWMIACISCGVIIASGTVLIPRALTKLHVANNPPARTTSSVPAPSLGDSGPNDSTAKAAHQPVPALEPVEPAKEVRGLLGRTLVLAAAVGVAWLTIDGLPLNAILGIGDANIPILQSLTDLKDGQFNLDTLIPVALRAWVIIWKIDVIWTLATVLFPPTTKRTT